MYYNLSNEFSVDCHLCCLWFFCCSTLFMHSLVDFCAYPGQGLNMYPWHIRTMLHPTMSHDQGCDIYCCYKEGFNNYPCMCIFPHTWNYSRINPKNVIAMSCWETILHGSLRFLHVLWTKALSFYFRIPFQGYLCGKQTWDRDLSPSGAKARLFTIQCHKDTSSGVMLRQFYCLLWKNCVPLVQDLSAVMQTSARAQSTWQFFCSLIGTRV